jgi:DNA polymerase elongation subunit (family B)
MVDDWDTFIDYNIQDVNILVKLEEKLQFISLIRMISYIGCTTFEGALGTLGIITGAACIRARKKGQRISTFIRKEDDGSRNPGAYVAEPLNGFQEDIVSFDANSLYPNLMISLNMSPETKVGKIIETTDEDVTVQHVNGQVFKLSKPKFAQFIKKEDIAITKAKVLFTQKNKGIVPEMVDFYYQKRKVVQAELKKYKKQLADINKEIEKLK